MSAFMSLQINSIDGSLNESLMRVHSQVCSMGLISGPIKRLISGPLIGAHLRTHESAHLKTPQGAHFRTHQGDDYRTH